MRIVQAANMPKPNEYLFIDGAYLRECLDNWSSKFFTSDLIELDFNALAKGFQKTFYYDCYSPKKRTETAEQYEIRITPQREFFNYLRELNGFHVYEGTISGEGKKARQKQVDIMIAVHMLSHTIRGNMAKTTLLAGDLDYKPLIDALILEGIHVSLWCERRSTSRDLVYSADARRDLSLWEVWNLATNEFKKKFPLPRRYSHGEIKREGLKPIQQGTSKPGDKAEILYDMKEKLYRIIYKDLVNEGRYIHIDYPDRDFLEQFLLDEGIKFTWN
jgi:uncharacterized LabA/DUF88 family protein